MASLSSLFCVVVIILSSVSANKAAGSNPEKPHQALFVFGDSLFDPGNNLYLNNSVLATSKPPYGETYFKHPTGRFSDGRTVPDFIAQFAKLPLLSAYLKPGTHQFTDGANFASGGAACLTSIPGTINLATQLSHFKDVVSSLKQKLGDREAKKILSNAVYLFSMGGNDYFGLYNRNPNVTHSYQAQYSRTVIGNLTNSLKEIYNVGGRKIAFQNVGPLGCVPANRAKSATGGCVDVLLAMARRHNRALSAALKNLERTLPGFKYSIFDYYNALSDLVNNPSKYGLKEGKEACCGSGAYRGSGCGGGFSGKDKFEVCSKPSEYVWFDGGHTTEMANYKLAELIWNGAPTITGPYTVKQLFELV